MYDQSHPGEEALKAEKIHPRRRQEVLPGDSAPPRRPILRLVKHSSSPPHASAKFGAQYQKASRPQGLRARLALAAGPGWTACAAGGSPSCSWIILAGSGGKGTGGFQAALLGPPPCGPPRRWRAMRFLAAGARQFFTLRPRGESVLLFAFLFNPGDGLHRPPLCRAGRLSCLLGR